MIVVLKHLLAQQDKKNIIKILETRGFKVREIVGEEETILGAVGVSGIDLHEIEMLEGVDRVIPISKPYKLASRELRQKDSIVKVHDISIGGDRIVIIAGPCAVESRQQIMQIAESVAGSGAVILRGGAFKPRTSPYAFQGLGEEGLKYLQEAGRKFNMPVVSEVVASNYLPLMDKYIDIFQIGTRNMQNFELLKEIGKYKKPVILKRGYSATIEEWLMAAEYLLAHGTDDVILCERGIRTFETATRNTLDLSALPVLKQLTHLPVIVDPSHATGRRDSVAPMGLAAISAGANGLVVEVHNKPEEALSDGAQSLYPNQFEKLMRDIQVLAPVVGKEVARINIQKKVKAKSLSKAKKGNQKETFIEVGFQGEPGAYSEAALYRFFEPSLYVSRPFYSFRDVFDSVLSGEIEYGILPVENSLAGSVHQNYDLIFQYPDIMITGETRIRVEHNLIGFEGVEISQIKKVYSHPQALAQSSRFLDSLENIEKIPVEDTSGAVKMIAENGDRSCAAVASSRAASIWGMSILKSSLETNPRNYTRFVVIERGVPAITIQSTKASLVFSVKDKSGALFSVLALFDKYNFNLKKLESRPILGKPWAYMFYVDIELGENRDKLQDVVNNMEKNAENIRILGYYKGFL